MKYDSTYLTFCPDPNMYLPGPDEICIRIPVAIASEEDLISLLNGILSPIEYYGGNWNVLHDVLRFWKDRKTAPGRVVIVHSDLPFLESSKDGWNSLQTYIHILLDSINFIHTTEANAANAQETHALVAIFPSHVQEEIQSVLNHPPAWTASIGFYSPNMNCDLDSTFDPAWSTIQLYIQSLDGLLAESCTLTREGTGSMTVQYSKTAQGYYLEYSSPDWQTLLVASVNEHPLMPAFISLSLASQTLETFFRTSERSTQVYWSPVSQEEQISLQHMREEWFAPNEKEAQLESAVAMVRITVLDGMKDALYDREPAFSLEYWKNVLVQVDAPLFRHLTALCVVGFSTLPEALELIRPFLRSPQKQERWVSARFMGGWSRDEEVVVPVLLSMLTDEMPLKRDEEGEYDPWYDSWRPYAPRILQKWLTPAIRDQLRHALNLWSESESQLDPEYDVWRSTVKEIASALHS